MWSKDVSCLQLTCQVKVLDAGLEREMSRFPGLFQAGTVPCGEGGEERRRRSS